MAAILLDLSEQLIHLCFKEWMDIADLGRFDNALCSRATRAVFVKVAFGKSIAYDTDKIVNRLLWTERNGEWTWAAKRFMHWAMKRNLAMHSICISPATKSAPFRKWLAKTGANVTGIVFRNDGKLVYDIERTMFRSCPNVSFVQCSSSFDAEMYGKIAKFWLKLTAIVPHAKLDNACASIFSTYCTTLTSLDVSRLDCKNLNAVVTLVQRYGPTLSTFCTNNYMKDAHDTLPLAVAKHCPVLRTLKYPSSFQHPASTLLALLQGCPRMQEVEISSYKVEKESYDALALALGPQLISLTAGFEALDGVTRFCPNVRRLYLYCSRNMLHHHVANRLANNCPHVEVLVFFGCGCIAPRDVVLTIAAQFKQLREFNVDYSELTEKELIKVMQCCPHLRVLTLDRCENLTNKVLLLLPQLCPHIEVFGFDTIKGTLKPETLQVLAQSCRKLHSLYVPMGRLHYAQYYFKECDGCVCPNVHVYASNPNWT